MRTRNSFRQRCLTILTIVFLSAAVIGCAGNPRKSQKPVSRTGFAFDTIVTITLYHSDKENVLDHCLALCESYEALFSATKENSDLWKINHSNRQHYNIVRKAKEHLISRFILSLMNGISQDR